jgi:hypothetical protein
MPNGTTSNLTCQPLKIMDAPGPTIFVAPKEVFMAWAEQWREEDVKVDWEKLLPPKGIVVLPPAGWWNARLAGSVTTEG